LSASLTDKHNNWEKYTQ